MLIRFLAVY